MRCVICNVVVNNRATLCNECSSEVSNVYHVDVEGVIEPTCIPLSDLYITYGGRVSFREGTDEDA